MNSSGITASCATVIVLLMAARAMAHDPPPGGCGAISRDIARELAVMRSTAIPVTAAPAGTATLPLLEVDWRYAISLIAQTDLRFSVKPGRAARGKAPRGGAFQFQVPESGRYRVSITSRHWIDVVDAETMLEFADHLGPGCDLVHKIVEFDMTAGKSLTLQLSGQDDAIIGLAITASPNATARGNP